ncbi:MAG: Arginine transport ATP-binding protein ArtM [Holosporales bacterium]
MLKITHLFKSFKGNTILNDIHLTLDSDQIIGLAGPSGGGKSTLLRCLQGLETIDSGQIETTARKGFMFQDFQLFPHMTVYENLVYAPKRLFKKDPSEKARALLDELGLSDKENAYPSALSGGQKQRVALARALMLDPQLMLLDEPTSGLDIATIDQVIDLLTTVKNHGASMIIASHDLDFLSKIADRIILLKQGRVALDLTLKETDHAMDLLKKMYGE